LLTVSRPHAVPIHRPPTEGAHHFRRLRDAAEMRGALKKFGAGLVLHRPSSNLHEIDGEPGAWRCTLVSRGWH
jgi:hypothetical protein